MRYYLHIHNAVSQPDEHGSEWADDATALGQAAMTAGEILRDEISTRSGCVEVEVVVENGEHRRIGAVKAVLSLDNPT